MSSRGMPESEPNSSSIEELGCDRSSDPTGLVQQREFALPKRFPRSTEIAPVPTYMRCLTRQAHLFVTNADQGSTEPLRAPESTCTRSEALQVHAQAVAQARTTALPTSRKGRVNQPRGAHR